jgi:hypothetical protein
MKQRRGKQPERRRRFVAVAVLALAVLGWAAYWQFVAPKTEVPVQDQQIVEEAQQRDPGAVVRAGEALGRLAVREAADRDGYAREQFSDDWARVAGCDMRNRILQRDLEDVSLDDDNCTVLSGVLANGPYTGNTINFQRGRSTSQAVQIDHVVAVSNAWQTGAQELSRDERHAFYNDPLNLLAVDGPANMQKGAADASDWLPHAPYRCQYVARQIAVKLKYELWVTRGEHNAMKRVLGTCPGQLLPIAQEAVTP